MPSRPLTCAGPRGRTGFDVVSADAVRVRLVGLGQTDHAIPGDENENDVINLADYREDSTDEVAMAAA